MDMIKHQNMGCLNTLLLILVAGMPGSGKSLFVKIAVEKYGLPTYTMGDVIREDAVKMFGIVNQYTMLETSRRVRQIYGPGYVASKIIQKIRREEKTVLIDGVRSLDEVKVFRKYGETVIVAIHASPRTRFERLRKRGREGDPSTWEEFVRRDYMELSFGIGDVIALADYMIVNEGSIDETLRNIENVLDKIIGVQ